MNISKVELAIRSSHSKLLSIIYGYTHLRLESHYTNDMYRFA